MTYLSESVVIITGAAQGQGAEEARIFARNGAHVVIADVADDAGEQTADSIGERAHFIHLDVSDAHGWEQTVEFAASFGKLRFLVNNAALHRSALIVDEEADLLRRVLDVNVVGAFLGMKACRQHLAVNGGGAIVNVASISGMLGVRGRSAYGTSKWALRGLTKVAAGEFATDGIRVNCVLPGPVQTAMLRPEDVDAALAHLPLGRLASPAEIAEVVFFLCSESSSFITGADVPVDGGFTAVGPGGDRRSAAPSSSSS